MYNAFVLLYDDGVLQDFDKNSMMLRILRLPLIEDSNEYRFKYPTRINFESNYKWLDLPILRQNKKDYEIDNICRGKPLWFIRKHIQLLGSDSLYFYCIIELNRSA
ncbi:hypothetical protein GJ496_002324 [Pomphorhynchus laevis]|nr:hypothetical protein GJ496_002324 [Pomphorhynchus laevis]